MLTYQTIFHKKKSYARPQFSKNKFKILKLLFELGLVKTQFRDPLLQMVKCGMVCIGLIRFKTIKTCLDTVSIGT